MPPTVHPRSCFRTLALIALPALASAGCGVADYEKKMQDAEARLQRFDDENKVLGDPLSLPAHTEKEQGAPLDVFLRPPKGVASKDKTQPGELAYHYPATGGVCTDLYLTFGNKDDGRDKLEKEIENRLGAASPNWQPVEIHPPFGRPAIPFDAVQFIDPRAPANAPANYIAYVHQAPGQTAVGVVFRVPQSNQGAADAAIKMSLETFAEAGDVSKARAVYGKPMAW